MHRIRTIARATALGLAAALVSIAPAEAAPQYEVSATKNGVVKAHAVYFSGNNTLCVNLLNAPNPGAYAAVSLFFPSGQQSSSALFDTHNDGVRNCIQLSSGLNGESRRMQVFFHPQQGADVVNDTWIIL
jgi:hypothetical protein